MAFVKATHGRLSVTAYRGDFKTLLAFDLAEEYAKNLAGFTIQAQCDGVAPYFLLNELQFKTPSAHAQDSKEPANSSINAPFQKLRWVHVPGMFHQGLSPVQGSYAYTVTPRYFDGAGSMLPLDSSLGVTVTLMVAPFAKGNLEVGFTRGFTQSQAFVHHFGLKALIQPPSRERELVFDTSLESGKSAAGQAYTYLEEYRWLGFTARMRIFDVIDRVVADPSLELDVFAYDLSEPDILARLLTLGRQHRVRIILDNSRDHHDTANDKPEDRFEKQFREVAGGAAAKIRRGKFRRYAHDKILIVSKNGKAQRVLTGSTNFSVTGLYVNSNHVLVFNDAEVAARYEDVFEMAWNGGVSETVAVASPEDTQNFRFSNAKLPATDVTFAPHSKVFALSLLTAIADRVKAEGAQKSTSRSVLFAVMGIKDGKSSVYDELRIIHKDDKIFSYGISDDPGGIALYKPGTATGLLVTGKPVHTILPKPFSQVRNVGLGHQIHHKFVVCSFNNPDAVVVCGSSNLASGGEESNGDNLLLVYDQDIATVFAIEALALVDHFEFLDRYATGTTGERRGPVADTRRGAIDAQWFLHTNDAWVRPYYQPDDLHDTDRLLFSGGASGPERVPAPWQPPQRAHSA